MATSAGLKGFLKAQKPTAGRNLRLVVALSLANGALIIAQAWIVATIVNAVAFKGADLAAVTPWLTGLIPLFGARAALVWATEQAAFKAAAAVKRDLRTRILDHLMAAGPVAMTGWPTGQLVSALTDALSAIEPYYSRYLPALALASILPAAILAAIAPSDWVSGLVLVLTAPFIPVFMVLIGDGAERMNRRQWQKLARMSGHFLDTLQGLTTLKIFNASRREARQVASMSEAYRRDTMMVLRLAFLSSLALEFFATLSIAIVAVLIGFRLLWAEMAFFNGFFVLLLAPEFYLPLRTLGSTYHARMEAIGAAERAVDILDTPRPERCAAGRHIPRVEGVAIRFEDVCVTFADGRNALDGLSLKIGAGERVALVGPSGAGKTTVLNLLLGFVQPASGHILINGIPFEDLDLSSWRARIAYLPQRPHMFNASIGENIAMAAGGQIPDADIAAAAHNAYAGEFISALPEGYSTILGEKGAGLSGGEIQRIGLARAFCRDAPLVLMDEATAHLDQYTESVISGALDALASGRTSLTAAHRLATVRNAHRIIVLEAGRAVNEGPPSLLLKNGSLAPAPDHGAAPAGSGEPGP